jgi:SAM-dependent methyltransferase
MRPNVRAFVEAAVAAFAPRGPVYEFGAYQVPGQEAINNLRGLFPGVPYVGCDLRPGPGVDRLEDLGRLSLPDNSIATILCLDTLEHVFECRRAAAEMIRVLRPGGLLVVSVPLDFHIHQHPDDYWRLTPSCLARLLAPLGATVIGSQGPESYPHTVFGIGVKSPVPATFVPCADYFTRGLQGRVARLASAVPRRKRWKARLRRILASKGERRRQREHFVTRFVVDRGTTGAAAPPCPPSGALKSENASPHFRARPPIMGMEIDEYRDVEECPRPVRNPK